MKRGILILTAAILLAFAPLGLRVGAATAGCDIRIMELGTAGRYGASEPDREAQDFMIVRNVSATTSFVVQLVYIQSNGVRSETGTISLGTIAPNVTKTFVSPMLSAQNPGVTVLANMNLASSGGTVLIQKTSGAVYCDQLGWGQSALYETAAANAPAPGATSVRDTQGSALDSNNNAADFIVTNPACAGAEFSELQPFVTDTMGGPLEAWVELRGATDPIGNCMLLTGNGDRFVIPQADLPAKDGLAVLDRGIGTGGAVEFLRLGETGGDVWLADRSYFASDQPVYFPVSAVSFPALERGQTWSLIDGLWRPTYSQTPTEPNAYLSELPRSSDAALPDCAQVRISELLPNPSGDDADNEWVELHNPLSTNVLLAGCKLNIDGEEYYFSEYDGLAPGEYRAFSAFSSNTGSVKNVTIRNTSDTHVLASWTGKDSSQIWQSFYLYDGDTNTAADEGIAWSKFDDGWRWTPAPTPGGVNSLEQAAEPTPTESAAVDSGPTSGTTGASPGLPIAITELLPNPAAPLSDDSDEYVELQNQNTVAVNVLGYTLQTGTKFSYSYTLPSMVIEPGAFAAIMSKDSSLLLSNTSGQARLLDPAGTVVSQTDAYTDAAEGVSWALVDGVWKWTSSPTQAGTNAFVAAVSTGTKKAAAAKTAKATTAKTTKSSGTTKSAKTTTPAAASAKDSTAAGNKPAPVHTAVLAAVGLVGVLYAAYEYRTDIANYLYKLRSHRTARGQNRPAVAGR